MIDLMKVFCSRQTRRIGTRPPLVFACISTDTASADTASADTAFPSRFKVLETVFQTGVSAIKPVLEKVLETNPKRA
jgi:hypothetical protein